MKHKRGSVMVFSLILVATLSAFVVGMQALSMDGARRQQRLEADTQAAYVQESSLAYASTKLRQKSIALPASFTITVNGKSVSVNCSDNSADVPRTMSIQSSVTISRKSYTKADIVGQDTTPPPWYYGLFVDGSIDFRDAITVGTAAVSADAYIKPSLASLSNALTVKGDLECVSTIGGANVAYDGQAWSGAPALPFPSVAAANYSAAANRTYFGNQTFAGVIFPVVGVGSNYPIYYVNGDIKIDGGWAGAIFMNKGVLFATGDVSIKSNVTLFGGAKLAVIAMGDIDFSQNDGVYNGYFYAGDEVRFTGGSSQTVNLGSVACSNIRIDTPTTIKFDTTVWNTPNEGTRLRLPGMWP